MKPLYLQDSYLKEADAKVESVKDGKFVVLDNTIFYPQGGGQPYDTGKLVRKPDGKEFNVVFVGKFDGKISHQIEPEGELHEGDEVHCALDWDRRYKLMRMHTAAHVISGVLSKETGALITGNQLGSDKTRIDFSGDMDKEKSEEYIAKANEIIAKDLPIEAYEISREEAEKDESLFKLAKALPESLKILRILDIKGFDKQADAGTHVKSLKEVGKLKFQKFENKGSKNKRLYFELEP